MNKKIFRSVITASVLVLVTSIVLVMGVLYDFFEKQLQSSLESEAVLISQALESGGENVFSDFKSDGKRLTLIDSNGNVIADTFTDAEELDNHSHRSEVKQALESGRGMSIRYSDTLMSKTVYYAVRLSSGNVLRIATAQDGTMKMLLELIQPIIIILLVAFALSLFLSSRAAKSIIKPINAIDPDHPEESEVYDELSPLLSRIALQRKTIERHLKEAKQRQEEFNLITENMSEGLLVIDDRAAILTYNSAAVRLLGIENPKNSSALMVNRTKDFRELIEQVLLGTRKEKAILINGRSYNLIATPVFEEDKCIGAVIVILDITEMSEREQLRREFTANVSHELKTPLASISGFAEMMKEGGTAETDVKEFSNIIYKEAQRLISLVNDIIKLSELDGKSVSDEKENVDIYALSGEIIARLKAAADKKNVSLNLIGSKAEVCGVRKIIDEMVYNLADNAVKYNRENGIVDIIIHKEEKFVKITVRDNGIGIPKGDIPRVFERFYRVDKSHSKAIGGTGLGLSIVKHGAAFHDALLSIESTEGKGTSVTISFPDR
jgi:two-component system phosphate regulon sensor histidine kinase PhoR